MASTVSVLLSLCKTVFETFLVFHDRKTLFWCWFLTVRSLMKASSATARGGKHYLMRRSCEIKKPRHRQRQQPAQRPRSQAWKHVGRRSRSSRAQGSFRRILATKGQRNPDRWSRRRKQRRRTSQHGRHHKRRRNQSQKTCTGAAMRAERVKGCPAR